MYLAADHLPPLTLPSAWSWPASLTCMAGITSNWFPWFHTHTPGCSQGSIQVLEKYNSHCVSPLAQDLVTTLPLEWKPSLVHTLQGWLGSSAHLHASHPTSCHESTYLQSHGSLYHSRKITYLQTLSQLVPLPRMLFFLDWFQQILHDFLLGVVSVWSTLPSL